MMAEKFHDGKTTGDLFDHVYLIKKFPIIYDKSHT
jgi:hypothetical protein